jgi:hypothetical protein
MIITEWDGVMNNAYGFTQDGTPVRVVVTPAHHIDAKKKIIGRGIDKGYYVAPRLFNAHLPNQPDWVHWTSLSWCEFKPGFYLMRKEDHSFEICKSLDNPKDEGFKARRDWHIKTVNGCLCCKNKPHIEKADELHWINPTEFFCDECQSLPIVNAYLNDPSTKWSA